MKKQLVYKGLIMLISIVLIIAACLAWFIQNSTVGSDVHPLDVVEINAIETILYHVQYDNEGTEINEEPVDKIIIRDYIPGQVETYRIHIKNNNVTSTYIANLAMNGFTAVLPEGTSDGLTGDLSLCKKLVLQGMTLTGDDVGSPDKVLYTGNFADLAGGEVIEGGSIPLADKLIIKPLADPIKLTFQIKLSETADNTYQQKAVYAKSIDNTSVITK